MTKTMRAKLVFVGVSTGGSSIMKIFPLWSEILGINCEIVGVDLPLRAPASAYRRVLREIIDDASVKGALITAHKIDLLHACRDMFDEIDTYAELCDEVSCVIKREGRVLGFAVDPLSSSTAMISFVPTGHWERGERDVLCLGAGGAAVAISVCLAHPHPDKAYPRRFLLSDILPERLESIRRIHQRLDTAVQFEYHCSESAADNDALLQDLPAGSLVINATGMGKDKPGSPLTSAARFPRDGLVWELNYRGERDFMRAAEAQAQARNLRVEDGWTYFLRGWTAVIQRIFDIQIYRETLEQLNDAASAFRPH